MTLYETVQMWEMQHSEPFWDVVHVHKAVDKDALINYLLYEFSDMQTIDSNSGAFRNHVKNFFDIHKWNIDKLADTLELEYLTLENVRTHKHNRTDEEHETVQAKQSKTEEQTLAVEDRKEVGTEDTSHDKQMTWSEKGNESSQDVHYISAFNDVPSPTSTNPPVFKDTEQYRDTRTQSYSKAGQQTENEVTDKDTSETEHKNNTEHVDALQHDNSLENTIDKVHEDNDKVGHDGGSYQSLIEEERKQAQFNIYKWIGKHFARELVVAVW